MAAEEGHLQPSLEPDLADEDNSHVGRAAYAIGSPAQSSICLTQHHVTTCASPSWRLRIYTALMCSPDAGSANRQAQQLDASSRSAVAGLKDASPAT